MQISDLLACRLDRSPAGKQPLNQQICAILREVLQSRLWAAGTKLPASRELAEDTGLSRNTVLYAYQQLLAEGWLVARGGSGTYVAETTPTTLSAAHETGVPVTATETTATAAVPLADISQRGEQLLRERAIFESPVGAFALGVSDTVSFPHATWARLLNRRWRRPPSELLTYAHGGGFLPLRRALAEHLWLSRSVNCRAEQVIITTGVHQAIALVCHMLADAGDLAWLEDPGYLGARSLLRAGGLEVQPVPVDGEGLVLPIVDPKRPPKLVYVTPSHQFPLGMVMSIARRQQLLQMAQRHGAWILEDDYDSEFRFEGQPLPSLHGMDGHGRVLYMGSLSKTLFPGMRIGYLVLPAGVAERCASGFSELYREGQLVQQAALADFIDEGHFSRHLRRMRRHYSRKQAILRAAVLRRLGPDWPISTHEAGVHLVLHLPDGSDDVAMCAAARAASVVVRPLSRHYLNSAQVRRGLLLGYAGVPDDNIEAAFGQLVEAIAPLLPIAADAAPTEAVDGVLP